MSQAPPPPAPSRYLPECSRPASTPPLFYAVDTETTGIDWNHDQVCSIAVVVFENGAVKEERHTLVNPGCPIPAEATAVHGLTDEQVRDAPGFEDAFGQLDLPHVLAKESVVVGHNVWFDLRHFARLYPIACTVYDTMIFSRTLLDMPRHTLDLVCARLGTPLGEHHNALADARAAGFAFLKFLTHPDEVAARQDRLEPIRAQLARLAERGNAYQKEKAASLLAQFPRWSEKQEAFARSLAKEA